MLSINLEEKITIYINCLTGNGIIVVLKFQTMNYECFTMLRTEWPKVRRAKTKGRILFVSFYVSDFIQLKK